LSEAKHSEPRFRLLSWEALIVFALALAVTCAVQWRADAYQTEFALLPDEPAHFVSATLVYDYLLRGAPEAPLPFAERYYLHYPKVGIGHWPPAFHTLLALWMMIFGVGRVPVLLFVGVAMALAALLTYWTARRVLGRLAAAAGALLFLMLPLSQLATVTVMTEAPLALLCLAAMVAYVRYLEQPSWKPAVAFGLFAAAGLLTKGSAIGLAFIPPLAVLLLWRWKLLLRWDFWAPAVIVVVCAGPWYYASGDFVPAAMGGAFKRAFLIYRGDSAWDRMLFWGHLTGLPILAAALIGWLRLLLQPGSNRELVSAAGAFVIGTAVLNVGLPESAEPRHIHHAAAVVSFFAVVGLAWAGSLLPRPARPLIWVSAATLFFFAGYREWKKEAYGLIQVAEIVDQDPALDRKALLVSSENFGEGAFVAEMALRNPHPRHVIVRANQLLARAGWSNNEYAEAYSEPQGIAAVLAALPVSAVVMDRSPRVGREQRHHELLDQAVALYPQEWKSEDLRTESGRGAALFRTVVEGRRPTQPLVIQRGFYSSDGMVLTVEEMGWPDSLAGRKD